MLRIWDSVVRPLVDAVPVTNLVEVGAEEGKSTRSLLRYLQRRDGTLHCVDPFPAFDPQTLQSKFGERFHFYRDLSLNVIPKLPRFDVGLLDGDHNWYTVFNELLAIERLHDQDPTQFPLLVLHDTGWPYGRRDLYYDPDSIPAEFRQPYARQGIFPNRSELVPNKGLNVDLCNALSAGGPRNGVLTGVEDYVAQSTLRFEQIDLPIYYGVTVLATGSRVESEPKLARAMAELQSPDGLRRLLAAGERLRCVENVVLQTLGRKVVELEGRGRGPEANH